jgi:hypothetical protein
MMNRRSFTTGALVIAAVPAFPLTARADGRPTMVFMGHEL